MPGTQCTALKSQVSLTPGSAQGSPSPQQPVRPHAGASPAEKLGAPPSGPRPCPVGSHPPRGHCACAGPAAPRCPLGSVVPRPNPSLFPACSEHARGPLLSARLILHPPGLRLAGRCALLPLSPGHVGEGLTMLRAPDLSLLRRIWAKAATRAGPFPTPRGTTE